MAVVAALVLALVIGLQLLLAAGMPLGRAAWGGAHRVLPAPLRWGSLAAALVLTGAAWVLLARAGLVAPGADLLWVRVLTWGFAGMFALNTLGNLASGSPTERTVMTPATLILVVCFATVALRGP